MRLFHLFEDISHQNLIIYPGRFSPPTKNHLNVYKYLAKTYGANNVYVATSDKVDPPRSPFNFAEKKELLSFAGIPADHIVNTKSPYMAREITEHFDPASTVLIFAVGQKDMEEDPRFNFKPKKDGSPSYFQPYAANKGKLETFDKHAYIVPIPNFKFELGGQQILGATQIRKLFAEASPEQQKQIFTELYGRFDPKLFALVQSKLAPQVEEGLSMDGIKKGAKHAAVGVSMAMAALGANPQAAKNPEVPVNPLYFRYREAERRENLKKDREAAIKRASPKYRSVTSTKNVD
jgi:hypothetical protein